MFKRKTKNLIIASMGCLAVGCVGFAGGDQNDQDGLSLLLLQSSSSTSSTSETSGSATIGNGGGSLVSNDGNFKIEIPAGAIPEEDGEIEFTLTKHTISSGTLNYGQEISELWEVTPEKYFLKDVKVELIPNNTTITGQNLDRTKIKIFTWSKTNSPYTPEIGKVPGWAGLDTTANGDKVFAMTRSFSLFAGGAPPPAGNSAPIIQNATYTFKAGCDFLPYKVRARVYDPDSGDTIQRIFLLTAPIVAGKLQGAVSTVMSPVGGEYFESLIPYEVQKPEGFSMQVYAEDNHGNIRLLPVSPFQYPLSSGNYNYINNYSPGSPINCAWEKDNPAGDPTDDDNDGVPNSADSVPNYPTIPKFGIYEIYPQNLSMEPGDTAVFMTYMGGGAASPDYTSSDAGKASFDGSILTAHAPGVITVTSSAGPNNSAQATVTIRDNIPPADITILTATTIDHERIKIDGTYTGDDGLLGTASTLKLVFSTSGPIRDMTDFNSAATIAHGLTPLQSGNTFSYTVTGLPADTTVYFAAVLVDNENLSSGWNRSVAAQVSAKTDLPPDVSPPEKIVDFSVSPTGVDSFDLTWTAVGDDRGVTSYFICRSLTAIPDRDTCLANGFTNSLIPKAKGQSESHSDGGRTEDTNYCYGIMARDAASNYGDFSGDSCAQTLNANDPPVANAGPDQSAITGNVVNLSGSMTDPDSGTCSANAGNYTTTWQLVTPVGSSATLSDPSALNPTFTADVDGEYTATLTARDDKGTCLGIDEEHSDSVVITSSSFGPGRYLFRTNNQVNGIQGNKAAWDAICVNDVYNPNGAPVAGIQAYYSHGQPGNYAYQNGPNEIRDLPAAGPLLSPYKPAGTNVIATSSTLPVNLSQTLYAASVLPSPGATWWSSTGPNGSYTNYQGFTDKGDCNYWSSPSYYNGTIWGGADRTDSYWINDYRNNGWNQCGLLRYVLCFVDVP